MMVKRLLFINRQAPHGSHFAKEQLQMAMVFAAFEQQVSMLFMDDGVFSLLNEQQPQVIGFEDFSKMYGALDKYYDIKDIFVDEESLSVRNLSVERLSVPVRLVNQQQIDTLMRNQDFILSA